MTDLERVARAIYADSYTQYGTCSERHWLETSEVQRAFCRGQARAAVEALMEPSASAAIAGARSLRDTFNNPNQIPRARACLQTILRAVLEGR